MTRSLAAGSRGYALLSVLWMTIGIMGLAVAITTSTRRAIMGSRNRAALLQARWVATSCLTRTRATVDRSLAASQAAAGNTPDPAWDAVDATIRAAGRELTHCDIDVRALGSRLDVNQAPPSLLAALLTSIGMRPGRAESLTSLLLEHRPYVDITDALELTGLDTVAGLDTLLDAGSGPIALDHAPPGILAILPGFTPAVVGRFMEARSAGAPLRSFPAIAQVLGPENAAAATVLPGLVVIQPLGWRVTIRARAGTPAVVVALEVTMGRDPGAARIGRRRTWIE